MSEIYINYKNLEDSITGSRKTRNEIENYISEIKIKVTNPISRFYGSDSHGYMSTASILAVQKINALNDKVSRFNEYEISLKNFITFSKGKDDHTSNTIAGITDMYIGKRTWYQRGGDWIYNTFCVELANKWGLIRNFTDAEKLIWDNAGNGIEKALDWFRYGNGKYVLHVAVALVAAVASIAGTIAAIVAIPFSAGASIPLVIACIGAVASSVGTVITVLNSESMIRSNVKALQLSDKPGAARYYGDISTLSGEWAKTDMGSASVNKAFKKAGKVIDTAQIVAETTAFLTLSYSNIGAIRDYRYKFPNLHIKGYSFSLDNIKHNIIGEFGFYLTKPGLQVKNFSKLLSQIKETSHNVKKASNYLQTQDKIVKGIWNDDKIPTSVPEDTFDEIKFVWKGFLTLNQWEKCLPIK